MTIPDDVMKAAQEVAKSCVERPYNKGTVAKAAERIARAIMAERERCAKVAEDHRARRLEDAASCRSSNLPETARCAEIEAVGANQIAAAIRRGEA